MVNGIQLGSMNRHAAKFALFFLAVGLLVGCAPRINLETGVIEPINGKGKLVDPTHVSINGQIIALWGIMGPGWAENDPRVVKIRENLDQPNSYVDCIVAQRKGDEVKGVCSLCVEFDETHPPPVAETLEACTPIQPLLLREGFAMVDVGAASADPILYRAFMVAENAARQRSLGIWNPKPDTVQPGVAMQGVPAPKRFDVSH